MTRITGLLGDHRGATSIEYAAIASLISIVAIAAMATIGTGVTGLFASVPNF